MPDRKLDVLFVHAGTGRVYQGLRPAYSAVEPPTWSLLLAQSCRARGFGAGILDCDVDNLTDAQAVERVREADPRLVVFAVYGSEPNQGAVRMAGAVPLASLLKRTYPQYRVCFTGSHTQALPHEVLGLPCVDFVLPNEGIYPLGAMLARQLDLLNLDAAGVPGLGWKDSSGLIHLNAPSKTVGQARMDVDMPGYAWGLVDLNRYRSHFWHGRYRHELRSPFAAVYTSLGCPFKCDFCMINVVNRADSELGYDASKSSGMRWWSAGHTLGQIDALLAGGVRTIRISDEMFLLNKSHYQPIVDGLVDRNKDDSLNLWCYARVDTVRSGYLPRLRAAGFRWICLGIESADTTIRREISKGSYEAVDVRRVVKEIEDADIDVLANYIFGLPEDAVETMTRTFDLSKELNTRMWNAYPAMALPGSPLYAQAVKGGRAVPGPHEYEKFGFLSYECTPLGTRYLSPSEVLKFRDNAFHEYWGRPAFQKKVGDKFGPAAVENIRSMLGVKLHRRLLGDRDD